VGINVGDIIIDGEDIFGDGVNVAARVENECEPGGVCLSGNAFEQVRGKTGFAFDDLGERSLKNIDRQVRLYAVRSASFSTEPNLKASAEAKKPHWPFVLRRADCREWDGPAALPPLTALRVRGGLSGAGASSCLASPLFAQ
jgi:hypothetical protein